MKRKIVATVVLALVILLCSPMSYGHSYVRDSSDHPLRYAAYLVYPFGIAAEYLLLRPIHWLVSQPDLNIIFGHEPKAGDVYFVWE
jgi:hypothetical protein